MTAKNPSSAANSQKTEFENCLFDLLDQTQIMTRKEWSKELGVTQSAISQWIKGITIPRAPVLRRLWERVLAEPGHRLRPSILRFMAMAERPARLVSCHSGLAPMVKTYVMRPAFDQFWELLQELNLLEQERVLQEARRLTGLADTNGATAQQDGGSVPCSQESQTALEMTGKTPPATDCLKERAIELAEQFRQKCGGQTVDIAAEVVKRLRSEHQGIEHHMQELGDWILEHFLTAGFLVEVKINGTWEQIAGEEPLEKQKFDEIVKSARKQTVRVRAIAAPRHSQGSPAASAQQRR